MPGAVHVYRSRSGRLSAPAGGYTAGELWWHGPRVAYEIDMARHPFTLAWPVDNPHGVRATVELAGFWRVSDPVAIVTNRVTDAEHRCRIALNARIGSVFGDCASLRALAVAARKVVPHSLQVAEGLRMEEISARVLAGTPDERLAQELLSDDDAEDAPDLTSAWRHEFEVASAGLHAVTQDGTLPPDERNSLITAALRRYAAMVTRLGDRLPARDRRDR